MIMGAADGSQQATVNELVGRLALSQSTVSELIDRSEAAGLVVRIPSTSDARMVLVRVTPEGERRLAETVSALRADRAALRRAFGGDGAIK